MTKKSGVLSIVVILVLAYSFTSQAYVWTIIDPTKIQQKLNQLMQDGVRSAERIVQDKAKTLTDFKRAIEQLQTADNNKYAKMQKVTIAQSETGNRQLQAEYMPHPDVCEVIGNLVTPVNDDIELCGSEHPEDPFNTGENSSQILFANSADQFAELSAEKALNPQTDSLDEIRFDSFLQNANADTRSGLPGNDASEALTKSLDLIVQVFGTAKLDQLTNEEAALMDSVLALAANKKPLDILVNPESKDSMHYAANSLNFENRQQVAITLMQGAYHDRTVGSDGRSKLSAVMNNGSEEEFQRRLRVITQVNPDTGHLDPIGVVRRESALETIAEINALFYLLEKSLNKEFASAIRTIQLEEINSGR